jgi:uncharacterized protein YaiE (UPF0345 family)
MIFEGVVLTAEANVYFDGRVTSRTFHTELGARKTLGIMLPGTYLFDVGDAPERLDILSGHVRARRPSESAWRDYSIGQQLEAPANSSIELEVIELLDYVCHFG